jgi:hypothetical protein
MTSSVENTHSYRQYLEPQLVGAVETKTRIDCRSRAHACAVAGSC